AAFLADRVGTIFGARVSGVTRYGLFVRLDESGADGLVPISTLPADFYRHEEHRHALVGQRWGRVYALGEPVRVRLTEAQPVTGSLVFHLVEGEEATAGPTRPRRPPAGGDGKGRRRSAARGAGPERAAPR